MDWERCKSERFVRQTAIEPETIRSLQAIATEKREAAGAVISLRHARLTLLYDALRSLLEAVALQRGYKIYNHECYAAFLKQVLRLDLLAEDFDEYRRMRNSINYYGRQVDAEEADLMATKMEISIAAAERLLG